MKRIYQTPILIVIALLVLGVPRLLWYFAEWYWFEAVGFDAIFVRMIGTRAALFGVVFVSVFALLCLNVRKALSVLGQESLVLATGEGNRIELTRRSLGRLVFAGALVLGAIFGAVAQTRWLDWLRYRNQGPFGHPDPQLGFDPAFYIFTLPLIEFARGLLLALVVLAIVSAGALYLLGGRIALYPGGRFVFEQKARRHLGCLIAILFLVGMLHALVMIPGLLTSQSGIIRGASYTDVHARIPMLYATAAACLFGALLSLFFAFGKRYRLLVVAVGLYLVVSIGGNGYAAFVQRFLVVPNEMNRERPFIERNIEATRRAFALEGIEERELTGDATLTREDIDRNRDTIDNVRLWDHQPLLDTFGQLQEIRTYYDFVGVDNDRYVIDGKYRQVMLSARELNSESLQNRTFVNERLMYTHGYGVTLGPVNEVTEEGLPMLFIKNLPPVSSVDISVDKPAIYFGERTSSWVLVKTRQQEFDYPKGDNNVYASYEGAGGVPIGGFLRKALFSVRLGSLKILLSNDLEARSRVMFHRNIAERVKTIAPFLYYDSDPYLVIADGKLVWMLDAYTATPRYPYSAAARSGINYIRNSVKVAIDAYDGKVAFYLADPSDPLAATLGRIFPAVFKPLEEMPPALRKHIRYPEGIFAIQAAMYSTYHMQNPEVFYNKEDQWDVPRLASGAPPMEPYYVVMRLPGEERAEFIQMLPFVPTRKDNLAAWMVARSDAPHYGKMRVFRFPKQKVVFGPRQIVARINQDQQISPKITLWNQQGSEVIQGTLLVIPIEESLLYIRPLYLRSPDGKLPELKRVIVAYQNRIVMAEGFEEALDQIFEPGAAPIPPAVEGPPAASGPGAIGEAYDHYRAALEAQRAGDWARYGEEIRQVGKLLESLLGSGAEEGSAEVGAASSTE